MSRDKLKEGGSRVHLVDAATNVHYVLKRAEQYENLSALLAEGEEFDARELYPLMASSAAAAGWDDPDLDAYGDARHPFEVMGVIGSWSYTTNRSCESGRPNGAVLLLPDGRAR